LLILIRDRLYPIRGHDGKKNLENANMKAPGELEFPFGAFFCLVCEKQGIPFFKKFSMKRKGGCP
jgi:hypothetical protein